MLLTVLLAPVVGFFDRRGLGRVAPVILFVVFAFSLLGPVVAVRGAGKGGKLELVQSGVQEVTIGAGRWLAPGPLRRGPSLHITAIERFS